MVLIAICAIKDDANNSHRPIQGVPLGCIGSTPLMAKMMHTKPQGVAGMSCFFNDFIFSLRFFRMTSGCINLSCLVCRLAHMMGVLIDWRVIACGLKNK